MAHGRQQVWRRRFIADGIEQERCEFVPGRSGGDVLSPTVLFDAIGDEALPSVVPVLGQRRRCGRVARRAHFAGFCRLRVNQGMRGSAAKHAVEDAARKCAPRADVSSLRIDRSTSKRRLTAARLPAPQTSRAPARRGWLGTVGDRTSPPERPGTDSQRSRASHFALALFGVADAAAGFVREVAETRAPREIEVTD